VIELNVSGISEFVLKLNNLDTDNMLLEIATDLKAEIRKRVHVRGETADGSKIGTYSEEYMKVRTNDFKSKTVARGVRKGQKRPVHNRDNSRKVILSLTRQMESGLSVIKTEGGYGIGHSNSHNYDKAIWNEERYGKPIWDLSEKEKQMAENIVEKYVRKINY